MKAALETTTVAQLIAGEKQEVLEIDSRADLQPSFQALVDRQVLSAPVYDSEAGKYVGFLDVKDLVSFVVFREDDKKVAHAEDAPVDTLQVPKARSLGEVVGLFEASGRAAEITVSYLARRHSFRPVGAGDALMVVARELATSGVHRVPVLGEDGRVSHVISQSTLIRFLSKVAADDKENPALTATLSAAGIGTKQPKTVPSTERALKVFRMMSEQNRSGVPVTDPSTGRLVGNTSGSDLKLLIKDVSKSSKLLHGTIMDFLAAVRNGPDAPADVRHPAMAVQPGDTVARTIDKISATHVHRLFVTDGAGLPLAVVSITDILEHIVNSVAATAITVDSA